MTSRADRRTVTVDPSAPAPGRFDPARAGRPDPRDREPRPEATPDATPEDAAATRAELEELKRRTRRGSA